MLHIGEYQEWIDVDRLQVIVNRHMRVELPQGDQWHLLIQMGMDIMG